MVEQVEKDSNLLPEVGQNATNRCRPKILNPSNSQATPKEH